MDLEEVTELGGVLDERHQFLLYGFPGRRLHKNRLKSHDRFKKPLPETPNGFKGEIGVSKLKIGRAHV